MVIMKDAIYIINKLQLDCMSRGYYIALAGGVLNRGFSNNDLDLVAVPREVDADEEVLISYVSSILTYINVTHNVRNRSINVYHFRYETIPIDFAVIRLLGIVT